MFSVSRGSFPAVDLKSDLAEQQGICWQTACEIARFKGRWYPNLSKRTWPQPKQTLSRLHWRNGNGCNYCYWFNALKMALSESYFSNWLSSMVQQQGICLTTYGNLNLLGQTISGTGKVIFCIYTTRNESRCLDKNVRWPTILMSGRHSNCVSNPMKPPTLNSLCLCSAALSYYRKVVWLQAVKRAESNAGKHWPQIQWTNKWFTWTTNWKRYWYSLYKYKQS